MKQLKLFTLLGMLLFTFINCEYDEKQNVIENNINTEKQPTIKKLNFEQLSQNKKLINKLNKISNRKNTIENVNGKIVFSSENNFFINTDDVFYIEQDSLNHSYTFRVYRDSSDVLLENLILNSNDSIGYDLYLAKYDITQTELEQLENGQTPDLSQKTSVTSFDDTNIVENIFSKAAIETLCLETYTVYGYCSYGIHSGHNMDQCSVAHTISQTTVSVWVTCTETIEVGGGGGEDSSNPVVTSPVHGGGGGAPPTETALANACNKIKNLHEKLPQLKQALLDLKATTNQNHENGIFCDVTAAANNLGSIQNIPTENSAGGQVAPNTNPPYKYIMIAHTHDAHGSDGNGTYSIFSWDDISTISNLLKDGHIKASEFVFYVITADGTQYAITIENSTKLNEFVYRVPTTPGTIIDTDKMIEREKLFKKYYKSSNGIKVNSNPVTDKRTFLEFLKQSNCGLALFEIDDTFDNYTQLYLDSSNLIKQKNCNK